MSPPPSLPIVNQMPGLADLTTEDIIRHSEVMAVVRALRSGRIPRIGETLDYFIEVPPALERRAVPRPQSKAPRPYRFEVEQWHLDLAIQSSSDGRAGRAL